MIIPGKPTRENVDPFFGTSQVLISQLKRVNGDRLDVHYIVRNGHIVINAQTEDAIKFVREIKIPEIWDEEAYKELTNHYNMRVFGSKWEANARKPEYPNSFTIGNKIYYP